MQDVSLCVAVMICAALIDKFFDFTFFTRDLER